MSDAEEVIKIDPDGKYVLLLPHTLCTAAKARLREEWLKFIAHQNGGVLVLDGGARLVRVESANEPEQVFDSVAKATVITHFVELGKALGADFIVPPGHPSRSGDERGGE